jgi:hypothetical protein
LESASTLVGSALSALRDQVILKMTFTLVEVGDEYRAPDGVRYSSGTRSSRSALDAGRLGAVSSSGGEPVMEEVLRVEGLPVGYSGTRRAIVRWSDGTQSEALRFYADEVLFCEGDLVGKDADPDPVALLPTRPRLAPVVARNGCSLASEPRRRRPQT